MHSARLNEVENIEYLVMDNDMSDLLLSRPILQSLSFNLDSHLTSIKDRFHDVDMSYVSFDADYELETKHEMLLAVFLKFY